MVVPKSERTKEDSEWIRNFAFEFKSPKTLREIASREQGSFYPSSNKGGNYNEMGRGNGGSNKGVLSRHPQHPADRYNAGSTNFPNDARRGRRATSEYSCEDSPPRQFTTNEDSYEDFLAWKESNSRTSCRARSEEDPNTDRQDSRRRRVGMFNM